MLVVLLLLGCVDQTIEEVESDPNFSNTEELDFTNFQQQTVDVQLLDGFQQPIHGILIRFYEPGKIEEGKEVIKGLSDPSGHFHVVVNLGNHIDQLVMVTQYIGLKDYLVIPAHELSQIKVQGVNSRFPSLGEIPGQSQENESSNLTVKENAAGRLASAPLAYLGSYDRQGVPSYLEPEPDVVTEELLSFINASLPEGDPVPIAHPRYLAEDAETNLVVEGTVDVWMTFVHEGAGYRNVLGYYTYPTGTEPEEVADLEVINIAFPNASFAGSGGGLNTGDKVYLGRFEQGTTIGFALMANGWSWRRQEVTYGRHVVFSNNALNPESTEENRYHSVLLWDEKNELFLVGFEDLNRDGGSDDDFNDAVFYITANPIEAISKRNVNPIDKPVDSDGDGVNDPYDEYPEDSRYAYRYSYPGESTYGTISFEDQWPGYGDYDFNDFVADYNYRQLADANNQMQKLEAEFIVKAIGAGFQNGFAVQLDLAPSAIANVTGNRLSSDMFDTNANGTESGQSYAVIPVTDDPHGGFEGRGFINTDPNLPYQNPDTIVVAVEFSAGLDLNGAGVAPFNPFLVINKTRGREVHISGYAPTDLVDNSYFGQGNDDTDLDARRYYKTKTSLPWGMNLPVSFDYPNEKNDIRNGFVHFNLWAESGGYTFLDWYLDKPGYRNKERLYSK